MIAPSSDDLICVIVSITDVTGCESVNRYKAMSVLSSQDNVSWWTTFTDVIGRDMLM